MIHCLIIEDDFASAINLQRVVEGMGLHVLAILENSEQVQAFSNYSRVDIILSDVKLGAESYAYDHLPHQAKLPPIIFISSFPDMDLYDKSNQLDPYVYLTKPVSDVTLQSAINGALKSKREKSREDIKVIEGRVFVRSKGKLRSVDPQKVTYLHSEGNYCYIYTSDSAKIVIRSSISNMLETLNHEPLMQIHRAYVANRLFIESMDISSSTIKIAGTELPVGRSYKKSIRTAL